MLVARIVDYGRMLIGDSLNDMLIVTGLSCVQGNLGTGPSIKIQSLSFQALFNIHLFFNAVYHIGHKAKSSL